MLEPGPIALGKLARGDDEDLLRQLDARYGDRPENYAFRLIALPLAALESYAAQSLDYYRDLVESDAEWEAAFLSGGEEPHWEFEDGAERLALVEGYIEDLRAGQALEPVVIEAEDGSCGKLWLLDGYHRLAAARIVGEAQLRAYELIPWCSEDGAGRLDVRRPDASTQGKRLSDR